MDPQARSLFEAYVDLLADVEVDLVFMETEDRYRVGVIRRRGTARFARFRDPDRG